VMLYDAGVADSAIGIATPLYYARTGENGLFTIRNIRKGNYRIIGLDDKNSNFTVEFADESIGAGTRNLELEDSLYVVMKLAKQPALKQNIRSAIMEPPGKLITAFSRPLEKMEWKFISIPPEKINPVYNAGMDTVILYCYPALMDSTQIIWFEDAMVTDTAIYRMPKSKK